MKRFRVKAEYIVIAYNEEAVREIMSWPEFISETEIPDLVEGVETKSMEITEEE